eukprot:COSAG02_NODE_54951_length_293_cov_0.798969_1_plen_97_part_11
MIVNQCVFLVCKNCAVPVNAAHWNSITGTTLSLPMLEQCTYTESWSTGKWYHFEYPRRYFRRHTPGALYFGVPVAVESKAPWCSLKTGLDGRVLCPR